jgi:two-component system response regulator YesN
MPGLNGLELIEKVNTDIKPTPEFILLSGYNDFSYAQKAMQLGALGYLTKPLDAEELIHELSRAAGIIESKRKAHRENLELIRYTANQLYNDILDGKKSEKLRRKAQFIFGIPDKAKMRVIEFITGAGSGKNNKPEDTIYDFLIQISGIRNENCIFYNGSGSYIAVIHDDKQKFAYCKKFQEQLSEKLKRANLEMHEHRSFWALISGMSDGDILECICKCGKQLGQLHTYCMLHPEHNVVLYDALEKGRILCEPPETGSGAEFPDLPYGRLINALKGNDASEISDVLDIFFEELDQKRYSSRLCSVFLFRLADVVRKMAYACGVEANKVILDFTESIGSMNPACKKLALDMCNYVFEKLNSNNEKPIVYLENEIINYIKENYRKNLSLQNIAENFSLSAIIISKIVRKKTGLKFNDYCNYLRIEYAKTLIASANMKVTAVCEESGYSDYNYFTEKFKEFAGVSPSEYKKKYS